MTTENDPGTSTPTEGSQGGDAPPAAPPAEPGSGADTSAPAPAPAPIDVHNPDSNAEIAKALNRQNDILASLADGQKRLNDALIVDDDDDEAGGTATPDDAEASIVPPDPPPQPHSDEIGVTQGDAKEGVKKGWRRFV